MSIQTNIKFLNANDPEFIAAKNGTPEEREEWEDINGSIEDRPGADLGDFDNGSIEHTEDEYGGYVIDISKIPSDATHIVVFRC
jgi:hypothetical protein